MLYVVWSYGSQNAPIYLSIYLSISVPAVHLLPVFSRHSYQFTASSDVKLPCFITLSTSLSHFTSGLTHHLPSGDQVILLGHLLSSMPTTCPCHFNMYSDLYKSVCVTRIFFSSDFVCLLCRLTTVNWGVSRTRTMSGWRLSSLSTLWNCTSELKGVWSSRVCPQSQDPWIMSRKSMLTGRRVRWKVLCPGACTTLDQIIEAWQSCILIWYLTESTGHVH